MGKNQRTSGYQTGYEWIGKRFDRLRDDRFVVLNRLNTIMHSPTSIQRSITTDMNDPKEVPSFIFELESEVYLNGRTTILGK